MYLEYCVVPILAVPKNNEDKFRFLGTGFFVGDKGHLVTCGHVVRQVGPDESLRCYQLGKKQEISLDVLRVMDDYDLALCIGAAPDTKVEIPLVLEPFVLPGSDVNAFGYLNEPKGLDRLPFCRRVMKGHITSIPESLEYPDSYELSFPALFGFSGAPLLYSFNLEGEEDSKLGIVGCIYGSRESQVIRHTESVYEASTRNGVQIEREEIARIVELGMAYSAKALIRLFQQSEIEITIYGETNT